MFDRCEQRRLRQISAALPRGDFALSGTERRAPLLSLADPDSLVEVQSYSSIPHPVKAWG